MIGKVIEGRYEGAIVNKLSDRNILYIQTEDGTKVTLSKSNTISIDDVTEQYPSAAKKTIMVLWDNFETSIIQIGTQEHERLSTEQQKEKARASTMRRSLRITAGLLRRKPCSETILLSKNHNLGIEKAA